MFNQVKVFGSDGKLKKVLSPEELGRIHWEREYGEFDKPGKTSRKTPQPREVREKTCAQCGKKFFSPVARAKFCHKPCDKLTNKKKQVKKRKKVLGKANCRQCGKEFDKRTNHHILCSAKCRMASHTQAEQRRRRLKLSGGKNGAKKRGDANGRN